MSLYESGFENVASNRPFRARAHLKIKRLAQPAPNSCFPFKKEAAGVGQPFAFV
jgi:hypothetical protein